MPKDVFGQHIRFIARNFKAVSLSEGLNALGSSGSNEIYAAINLDDGYMDNFLQAYPVLKKYNVPATIFLTTDFIGKEHIFWWDRVFNVSSFNPNGVSRSIEIADRINAHLKRQDPNDLERLAEKIEINFSPKEKATPSKMLGWKEIKEMAENGINFGSHSRSHGNLCLLDDDELKKELVDSKKEIECRLGIKVDGFTYPFGIFDERVKAIVARAGYNYARTSLKGINIKGSDRFLLKGIGGTSLLKTSFLANRIAANLFRS